MLNNKKFNIVLALLIAIGLWAYVIGETDPQDSKVYREIPIEFINEEVLEASGLAIKDISAELVNVTLKGTRANISHTKPGDITATVDLADAALGENQLKINLRVPDEVEIEDKSLNKVTVTVEKRVSKELEIRPLYQGAFNSEQEPITVEMSQKTVIVSGAESLVAQADCAQAVVEGGKVSEQLKTINSRLVPVDRDGKRVKFLKLSARSVQITAELGSTKTVSLEVPVVDSSQREIQRKVTVPKTITIKGKSSALEDIDLIKTEPVDISNLTESTKIELIPILPADVRVSGKSEETLVAVVDVEEIEEKKFSFEPEEIELIGLDEGQSGQIGRNGRVEVVVRGSKNSVSQIEKSDIVLSANLTDLEPGTHQVRIEAACSKLQGTISVKPEDVRIVIE